MYPLIAVPATLGLVYRAWSRKSLTPLGVAFAGLTATAHGVHPWSTPFALLVVFYLGGTKATKVKHDVKSRLTLSASGSEGGEGQRTHTQVLANSFVATGLTLLHAWTLAGAGNGLSNRGFFAAGRRAEDLLVVGIVANYAAVAADTFSSELGILSKSPPRLITSPSLRRVPPGTNGGVTAAGLLAGVLGAFTVAATSAVLLPGGAGEGYALYERGQWTLAMTAWGALGSVLDSFLGGVLQASVVDKRTGKVVEGSGGRKVLVHPHSRRGSYSAAAAAAAATSGSDAQTQTQTQTAVRDDESSDGRESRRIESGRDLLDNNAVNALMALSMSLGAMGVAGWMWGVSVWDLLV